jgi:hypothetical protein
MKKDSYVVINPIHRDQVASLTQRHIYSVSKFDEISRKCEIEVDKDNSVWVDVRCLIPVKVILDLDKTRYKE